jgi:hypothetical protein
MNLMKNAILSFLRMKLIVLGLLFTGLAVFSPNDMQAQGYELDPLYSVPSGNFVEPNIAIGRLEADLESLKVLMSQLNPNSSQYRDMAAKYAYYDEIRIILVEDSSSHNPTAQAIASGARIYTMEAYHMISKNLKTQYREDAIDLLRA